MLSYQIVHDIPGRMRIRYGKYAFAENIETALYEKLIRSELVQEVEINHITGSILLLYQKDKRWELVELINALKIDEIQPLSDSSRIEKHYALVQKKVTQEYVNEFTKMLLRHYLFRWFLPASLQKINCFISAFKYIRNGLRELARGKINVPVLDATSIGVSMIGGQFTTAKDIMFLLSVSELLEDYTRKKTSLQLKESLALHIDRVWVLNEGSEIEMPVDQLKKGDTVVVQTGAMIPVDGEIVLGEALINESSFTGEPLSKMVGVDDTVFAGTVVEEGRIGIRVRNLQQESRISKIVDMIDTNESLKAGIQSKAEHLADSIVPFSFFGFFGMLLLTRSFTRAASILLVDYSCAIKLSTSISVISAMQEASRHAIMVKGGKYLEAMAEADTIVFDKTGTLTNACPSVQKVTPMDGYSRDEVLRIAACLEEHFPHSVANAIVKQARLENLHHEEEHAKVEYIIAHGIITTLHGQRAIIGSDHFIFEDEKIPKTDQAISIIEELQKDGASSLIYLAIGNHLAGIISIYDPLKDEAKEVIQSLREAGFGHIVMLTGDCEHTAKHIARELGIHQYQANVLPEDSKLC